MAFKIKSNNVAPYFSKKPFSKKFFCTASSA